MPGQDEFLRACYYDLPVLAAAERYWQSPEWSAVRNWLPAVKGRALDLGAGNGIASYALAREGWETTALEPDASDRVGRGAIAKLARDGGVDISILDGFGENIPCDSSTFDLIHARQVLHHAQDLESLCREMYRVLRPGGMLIATREHVVTGNWQIKAFQRNHPLHRLYGGEYAYRLGRYLGGLRGAGFRVQKIWRPFDSVVNFAPHSEESLRLALQARSAALPGLAALLRRPGAFRFVLKCLSILDQRPGRLYSFVAVRPVGAS
jgi:SAM-dependent methyltransferase